MAMRAPGRWTFRSRWLWLGGAAVLINAFLAIQVLGRPVRVSTHAVPELPAETVDEAPDEPENPEFVSQVAQIERLPGFLPPLRGVAEVVAAPEPEVAPLLPPPDMLAEPEPEPDLETQWLVAVHDQPAERPVPAEAIALIDEMISELMQFAEDVEQRGVDLERMAAANVRITALSRQLDELEQSLTTEEADAPDLGSAARDRMRPAISRLMTALDLAHQAASAEAMAPPIDEVAQETTIEPVE